MIKLKIITSHPSCTIKQKSTVNNQQENMSDNKQLHNKDLTLTMCIL